VKTIRFLCGQSGQMVLVSPHIKQVFVFNILRLFSEGIIHAVHGNKAVHIQPYSNVHVANDMHIFQSNLLKLFLSINDTY